MMKLAILLALAATATASSLALRMNRVSPSGRIVGGQSASIEEVPYQVVFNIYGMYRCGGSIISENWVLTAAHCLVYERAGYVIRAGSTYASSGGSTHTAAALISHADFYEDEVTDIPHDDIGLVQVSTAFTLDTTRAVISLYNAGEEAVVGASAVTSGWGYIIEDGPTIEILQTVVVPIISKASCNASYSAFGGIPDRQICAGYTTGAKDACSGDSGGPLAINGRLAGVVSWGNGCARAGFPGVYAEVASYRKWITENSGI